MPKTPRNPKTRGTANRAGRFEEIVAAAARTFREKGFAGASMQDIADATGMLKGSLYNYINSKDDLLYWLVEDFHQAMLANMEAVQALDGDALVKLRALVEGHVRVIDDNFSRGLGFMADYRYLPVERSRVLVAERRSYERYIRTLVINGQLQGLMCQDLDPTLTQIAILTLLNAIFMWYDPVHFRWYDDSATHTLGSLGPGWADLIVNGVACTPSAHRPGHLRIQGTSPFLSLADELGS